MMAGATPPLFDEEPRAMAEASMRQFVDHIMPTLEKREKAVLRALHEYLERNPKFTDATGGEVARDSGLSILTVRPRLTGLHKQGILRRTAKVRASRAPGEAKCHGYTLALPVPADHSVPAIRREDAPALMGRDDVAAIVNGARP